MMISFFLSLRCCRSSSVFVVLFITLSVIVAYSVSLSVVVDIVHWSSWGNRREGHNRRRRLHDDDHHHSFIFIDYRLGFKQMTNIPTEEAFQCREECVDNDWGLGDDANVLFDTSFLGYWNQMSIFSS